MTNQEILEGLAQNDARVARFIYKTLAPPVYKFVLSNNGTRDEAADLFQETYLRVLKKIQDGHYRPMEKFEAYFLTIARNTWIDHLRAKKKRPFIADETLLLQKADEFDEEALFQLLLHDRRMTALARAWHAWEDTDCRRILQRFHYDNAKTQDIAIEENTSRNTLLQRLFKCRTKLFKIVSLEIEK